VGYMQRSVHRIENNGPRERAPASTSLKEAHELACQALTLAVDAAEKAAVRDHAAIDLTTRAFDCLQQRFLSPFSRLTWSN
jgi:hypothetical protein